MANVLNASPKVIRSLRANAQPILMPAGVAPDNAKGLQVPADERLRRIEVIRGDAEFRAKVGQALALRFADEEPSPHVEQRIYDGFPGGADEALMERFHNADWLDRPALATQIEDPRLSEFAHRLIYFERPDTLSDAKRTEMRAWAADRILAEGDSVPWMTVNKALRQADDLLKDASDDDARLLQDVKSFLYTLVEGHGSV